MSRTPSSQNLPINESEVGNQLSRIIETNAASVRGLKVTPQFGRNGIVTAFLEASDDEINHNRELLNQTCRDIEAYLGSVPGVSGAIAVVKRGISRAPASSAHDKQGSSSTHTANGAPNQPAAGSASASSKAKRIAGVTKVIAVAAGKGGVGKSTVSLTIALACRNLGLQVGILDADFYGPSLPILLPGCPAPTLSDNNFLITPEHLGLRAMSIGFLLKDSSPLIWRGPMLMKALRQLVNEVHYDGLDLLIIDMPPGTGDIALTLAQEVMLDAAVIVSTSELMALADASRCSAMFQRFDIPVLGWVENMSWLSCEDCERAIRLFGEVNFAKTVAENESKTLASLPFDQRTQPSESRSELADLLKTDLPYSREATKLGGKVAEALGLSARL